VLAGAPQQVGVPGEAVAAPNASLRERSE